MAIEPGQIRVEEALPGMTGDEFYKLYKEPFDEPHGTGADFIAFDIDVIKDTQRIESMRELLYGPFRLNGSVGPDIRILTASSSPTKAGLTFYAHKNRMARASSVFRDTFEVCDEGTSSSPQTHGSIPKIDVEETALTFAFIVGILYESPGIQYALLQLPFERQSRVWQGGIKCDLAEVTSLTEQAMQDSAGRANVNDLVRVWATASHHKKDLFCKILRRELCRRKIDSMAPDDMVQVSAIEMYRYVIDSARLCGEIKDDSVVGRYHML